MFSQSLFAVICTITFCWLSHYFFLWIFWILVETLSSQQLLTLDPLAQSLLWILHVSVLIVEVDLSLLSVRRCHAGKRIWDTSLDTLILNIRLFSPFNEIANMFLLLEPLTFKDSNQLGARRKSVTWWVEKCDQIDKYVLDICSWEQT